MCDELVVGVNSDEDLIKTKGPTIMTCEERAEVISHCKFVDEIVPNIVYTPTIELVDSLKCDFYAHGDDPCFDSNGVDIT